MTKCELCGTPVKIIGHTTKHYEPIEPKTAFFFRKEIEALRAKLAEHEKEGLLIYGRKIKLLTENLDVAVSALEKIADPRKRNHKEPDKYTEVGCMMNMAEEALLKITDSSEGMPNG